MRILITGNMGYVGSVLASHLRRRFPDADLIGYDSGLFAAQLVTDEPFPERVLNRQLLGDIRDLDASCLEGVDTVVHLSALSNDPMGNRFEEPTEAINLEASVRLARLAAAAGVKAFVFASSCSVYGAAEGRPRRESDALNPLTVYARSKIGFEAALERLAPSPLVVTCLRFATARGMSPRLRLDLVLNDFVASAVLAGKITVLSDGSPWRPLIDVLDMSRAIEWAIQRPASQGGGFLAVNTGADDQTYQVAELADAVARAVPSTKVSINRAAPPDRRSYKVDFALFRSLAPQHQPAMSLQASIEALKEGLAAAKAFRADFRTSDAFRLFTLERHMGAGRLSPSIRWIEPAATPDPSKRSEA